MTKHSQFPQTHYGRQSRGYLPHFDGGKLAQFITFRLFDALPSSVLIGWKEDLKLEPNAEAESIMRRGLKHTWIEVTVPAI